MDRFGCVTTQFSLTTVKLAVEKYFATFFASTYERVTVKTSHGGWLSRRHSKRNYSLAGIIGTIVAWCLELFTARFNLRTDSLQNWCQHNIQNKKRRNCGFSCKKTVKKSTFDFHIRAEYHGESWQKSLFRFTDSNWFTRVFSRQNEAEVALRIWDYILHYILPLCKAWL